MNVIKLVLIIVLMSEIIIAVELERISPAKESSFSVNQKITFSVSAFDSKGLTYSKWQISGRLQDKHILTGKNRTDTWSHVFYNPGKYYVSVAAYNILGESDVIIWKVNIGNNEADKPSIVKLSPNENYVTVEEGEEKTFRVEIKDGNCELEKIEWIVDGDVKETSYVSGCRSTEQFNYFFYSNRDYEVAVNVYNREGGKSNEKWNIDVKRKSKNYYANNSYPSKTESNSSNTSKKTKITSSYGFSYSQRSLVDDQSLESGSTFEDFLDTEITSYEFNVKAFKDLFGSQVGIWVLDGGDLTQTGGRVELLLKLGIDAGTLGINFYGGGGIVYQISELEGRYVKYKNESYGYSYSGGVELVLGGHFLFFAEFNSISASSNFLIREYYEYQGNTFGENTIEDLNVGSSGLSIGVGYRL